MFIAYNVEDLKNQYEQLSSGYYFSKDTMRFFNSRLTSHYERVSDTLAYFITTESLPGLNKRTANVRKAELVKYIRESDGRECYKIEISTIGVFGVYSIQRAKTVMHKHAVQERACA